MMELDLAKIEAAIVAQAVENIVGDDNLYERVKRGIEARIDALFDGKVRELVDAQIDRVVKEGFEREYRKVDSFGRPVGQPTSISKELERLTANYWQERVDRNGKPTESTFSSTSRAEWVMAQICADDFSKAMKQHVVNVAGALKDNFRAVLDQHISVLLSDVFKVQSVGDRDRKNPGASCISPPATPMVPA